MNVGIITLHRSHNNGAVLQAYALQKIIQRLGHAIQIIDYYPSAIREANRMFRPGLTPGTLARNLYVLSKYKTLKRLSDRLESFVQTHLHLTEKQYVTSAELAENPPKFDAYICGSDQVWNPQRDIEMGKPYFLNFVPPGSRRIAYAPSFGVSEIPASRREEIVRSINAIDFLSVREMQGQAMIKQLTGLDAALALDPTLLIPAEEWETITNPLLIEDPFILIYGVMIGQISELAVKVKRAIGMKTVAIYPGLRSYPIPGTDYVLRDVGPPEFLWLFQKAACTVVNTFHGVVFSIINQKPFLVTPANNPSRIISLLDILDLSTHWVQAVERLTNTEIIELMNSNIDRMKPMLKLHQKNSITFLETALTSQLD